MNIVDRNQDQLILHRRNWIVSLFFVVWIGFAITLSIHIIWQEWPQFWSVAFVLSLPLLGFVLFVFQWLEITDHLERLSNKVLVSRRKLFWVNQETYPLSDLREIRFETYFNNNEATVMLDFGDQSKSLHLPARLNHFSRPYDGSVNALVQDLRQWSGVAA